MVKGNIEKNMKTVIRSRVWETNSSSTNSIHIVGRDKPLDYINERIKKIYTRDDNIGDPSFDADDYISDGIFYLLGLEFETDSEISCTYYVLYNWIAKIQYLAMVLWSICWKEEILSGFETWDHYIENEEIESYLTKNSKTYRKFVSLIIEESNKRGVLVKGVKFKLENETYLDDYSTITCSNVEELEEMFRNALNDDKTLIFCDEAYHPSSGPDIKTIK